MKYDDILEINNNKLTKKYIQSLSFEERDALIDPIFNLLRLTGFLFPDDESKLKKSYQRIIDYEPDLENDEIFNNSSIGTDICKYFCKQSFFHTTEQGKPDMIEIFNDDKRLKALIRNRLGMDWLLEDKNGIGVNESFNLSFRMIVQGIRSMRLVNATSIFKPIVAKYMCMKYSEVGDTVGDYSCGFGARMLGAASCGRKYIGTDPLTVPELEVMRDFYELKDCKLINSGSEDYRGEENSIDLYYASPPYFSQEVYSKDASQAYNRGENFFYDVYWKKTLDNVKYMLKPNKIFALNILEKYDRVIDMAKEQFGEPFDLVKLKTIKSHLGKNMNKGIDGIQKFEPIYIFKNIK